MCVCVCVCALQPPYRQGLTFTNPEDQPVKVTLGPLTGPGATAFDLEDKTLTLQPGMSHSWLLHVHSICPWGAKPLTWKTRHSHYSQVCHTMSHISYLCMLVASPCRVTSGPVMVLQTPCQDDVHSACMCVCVCVCVCVCTHRRHGVNVSAVPAQGRQGV